VAAALCEIGANIPATAHIASERDERSLAPSPKASVRGTSGARSAARSDLAEDSRSIRSAVCTVFVLSRSLSLNALSIPDAVPTRTATSERPVLRSAASAVERPSSFTWRMIACDASRAVRREVLQQPIELRARRQRCFRFILSEQVARLVERAPSRRTTAAPQMIQQLVARHQHRARA
jgi:hypothetical protein